MMGYAQNQGKRYVEKLAAALGFLGHPFQGGLASSGGGVRSFSGLFQLAGRGTPLSSANSLDS